MTASTLLLVSWLAFPPVPADDPKPSVNGFDGAWCEVAPPGTAEGLRATFGFSRQTVKIDLNGQAMQGSFKTEPHWPVSVMILDLNTRDGKRLRVTGVCRLQGDILYLRLAPEDEDDEPVGGTRALGRAALVLTLERVGK